MTAAAGGAAGCFSQALNANMVIAAMTINVLA
jgi:hypothetical protein